MHAMILFFALLLGGGRQRAKRARRNGSDEQTATGRLLSRPGDLTAFDRTEIEQIHEELTRRQTIEQAPLSQGATTDVKGCV